jgi:putative aldouronate transport system permease protein
VDINLYEAAHVDGAGRWKQTLVITIPSLIPVITILLILSVGGILNAGFDQIFNLYNARVRKVSEIVDTYVYKKGIINMEYSYSSAIGLFKSVVAFILIWGTNKISHMLGETEYSIW